MTQEENPEWPPTTSIPGGKKDKPTPDAFKGFAERSAAERDKRIALGGRKLSFGVKFLDAALGGIFPNDLVLLGAKTGRGKTQLATIISQENAKAGKRVHYFALEAEEDEIERRAKFSVLYEVVRQTCREVRGGYDKIDRMNFLDWYSGELEDITGPLEGMASALLEKRFRTMHTFYRTTDFYATHFEKLVMEVQADTDLIVLDHLHYVDSDDASENRGYKEIVKRIRDTALRLAKPVVVIAHLRKSDRRGGRIVPDEEDFHGTSDVPKMATKAVLIAEDRLTDTGDPCLYSTFIAPVKCRLEGARTRYVGRVNFDVRSGRYVEDFEIGTVGPGGDKFEIVDNKKLPRWARS